MAEPKKPATKESQLRASDAYHKRHDIRKIAIPARPELRERWDQLRKKTGLSQPDLLTLLLDEHEERERAKAAGR